MEVSSGYPGRVSFAALVLSVAFHAVLLAGFAYFKMSDGQTKTAPRQIQAVIKSSEVAVKNRTYAKPKITRARTTEINEDFDIKLDSSLSGEKLKDNKDIRDVANKNDFTSMVIRDDFYEIDFYGNQTNSARVCFVVDASGSMQGNFGRVKNNLIKAVNMLEQDQFFNIIFYRNDRVVQLQKNEFLRASDSNKKKAVRFIADIYPLGKTNAVDALKEAFITAAKTDETVTIYFLTDGFELSKNDSVNFISEIVNFKNNLAPLAKINTIGFGDSDKWLLRKISEITSGRYTSGSKAIKQASSGN